MEYLASALTKLILFILLCFGGCVQAVQTQAPNLNVVMYVNADPGFPFWDSQVDFAGAVANAIDVNLNVHFIPARHRDRFGIVEYISKHLRAEDELPDLVISAFWLGAEQKLLKLLDSKAIAFISINSHISPQQFSQLGRPREKFPEWLAHLSPNDIEAGSAIAAQLIRKIREQKQCDGAVCPVSLFGFNGLSYAAVSKQRALGLAQAVERDKATDLFNIVHANWRQAIAASMMPTILERHGQIDGFWVASDIMAYGVVDGLRTSRPHRSALIGSMDWSPDTIDYIRNGEIAVSLGGHFMEAGWAILMFNDFSNGIDFEKELGTIITTKLTSLDKSNIAHFGPFLASPKWSNSTLRQYSKYYNKQLKRYPFDADTILRQQINASSKP